MTISAEELCSRFKLKAKENNVAVDAQPAPPKKGIYFPKYQIMIVHTNNNSYNLYSIQGPSEFYWLDSEIDTMLSDVLMIIKNYEEDNKSKIRKG